VTAVDPADVMLGVARKDDPHQTVTWHTGAAEAIPLTDKSCDVAWSLSTVHHWRDLDVGLAEVRRVLVSGGRFLATERRVKPGATGRASPTQAELFADRCAAAGFRDVKVTSHDTRRGVLLAVIARADT
jgi:ubiquinone/menaquinone biosynthesis C-methylase UbiE